MCKGGSHHRWVGDCKVDVRITASVKQSYRCSGRVAPTRNTSLYTKEARYCPLSRDCSFVSKYLSIRLAAGRGRPALPKQKTTFQTNTYQRRLAVGRTRNAPTTLCQSKCGLRAPYGLTDFPYNSRYLVEPDGQYRVRGLFVFCRNYVYLCRVRARFSEIFP